MSDAEIFEDFERTFPRLAGEDNAGRLRRLRNQFGVDHPVAMMAFTVRRREVDAEEAADPQAGLWYLSFCSTDIEPADPPVPGGPSFLGVCIVEASGPVDAVTRAWELGINPGGEVATWGSFPVEWIGPEWRDRLLTAAEADAIPKPDLAEFVE